MKIAFDLDGVVAGQSVAVIVLAKKDKLAEKIYYETLRPVLNPKMYLARGDIGFILTARPVEYEELTVEWCYHFFPDLKLINVAVPQWTSEDDIASWCLKIAEAKAEQLNNLEIDVYFEDMPCCVEALRKLCPNCRIILYGGRRF